MQTVHPIYPPVQTLETTSPASAKVSGIGEILWTRVAADVQ
jgi:hypothetical protein